MLNKIDLVALLRIGDYNNEEIMNGRLTKDIAYKVNDLLKVVCAMNNEIIELKQKIENKNS